MLKIHDNGDMEINASTTDMIACLYLIFDAIEKKYPKIKLKELLLDYAKANKDKNKRKKESALKMIAISRIFANEDRIKKAIKEILK